MAVYGTLHLAVAKRSKIRSEAAFYVTCTMLRRGYAKNRILGVLLNRKNGISAHIYNQNNPTAYVRKQIASAKQEVTFAADDQGRPFKTQTNIRIALLKVGVAVRYDTFADRTLIEGLDGFGPALDDAALNWLRLTIDQRFKFLPAKEMFCDVVADSARLNAFHPVGDYLDGLRWDGTPRIDNWLTTYAGAEDTDYTRAVGKLMLTAAVRRIRQPGCKFDEMVVFESPTQGTDKSSGLADLAGNDDWFSDDLPLNAEGKRVIESLRGKWIVEAAELSGMRRADVEHLKAFLSRRVDRARMSYDRLVAEVPRQCIIVGTTNSEEYLRDTTGNRRFWPIRVQGFDLKALRRDRDQLWAEAAAREATGVSIRLDPALWSTAAEQQAARTLADPFFEQLQTHLGQFESGRVSSESVWEILDVRGGQRTQDANARMGKAMRDLGWRRPNQSGQVRIDGKLVMGYVRGEPPWLPEIRALRCSEGLFVSDKDDQSGDDAAATGGGERDQRRPRQAAMRFDDPASTAGGPLAGC